MAGIGKGARQGILLKGGDSVHTFAGTDTFVFDKTGTLTAGYPTVTAAEELIPGGKRYLAAAAQLEKNSDHPLAKAIVNYCEQNAANDVKMTEAFLTCENVTEHKGMGMEADGILTGNLRLMEARGVVIPEDLRRRITGLQQKGETVVLTAAGGKPVLLFAVADAVREEAPDMVKELKRLGIRKLVMLTGDNVHAAEAAAGLTGIQEYHAELLPRDKLEKIREMQAAGRVVTFVGDGINDSPALTASDTGIAMGGGTDAAIESSDVVLIRSDLAHVAEALKLAKKTVGIMYQNIAIAVGTVLFLLIGLFAGYIHMSAGMLIHEASILLVIFNAMRLLL